MSAPTFDCEQATAHLGAIAPDGGSVFVGTVYRARSFTLPHELEGALDHAASLVAAGCDCFVTPGLFERDSDGSVSRDLAHVRGAGLAWCDAAGSDDGRGGVVD